MKLALRRIALPLAHFTLRIDAELDAPVTAIFGPSGAGKTSLLDLVAGLRSAISAFIALDDRVLTDTASRVLIPPHRRAISYVPQDLALFPHLNVRRNILYGHQPAAANAVTTFAHVVAALEIENLLSRSVTNLSGGEKQRVALARALLAAPRLLLLDEPMASLDRPLRARLLPYLRRIREEFQVPMLYVTHDPDEVAAMCDEVLTMERGQIISRGKASDLANPSKSSESPPAGKIAM